MYPAFSSIQGSLVKDLEYYTTHISTITPILLKLENFTSVEIVFSLFIYLFILFF